MGCSLRGVVVVTLLALAACSGDIVADDPDGGDADAGVDRSEALFEPDHLVEVAIEIDPADWDALRTQTRSWIPIFSGCLREPFLDPFTYFTADVTIDGERVEDVGLRKKGFLGSLSETKPSLKIKANEFVAGQRLFGLKTLSFNNSVQDPSFVRQCLTYDTFRAAGIPAPRCNFAHVTVNGADLGLYVHVETVNKDFLARHFEDDEGNLYEGTLSDFRPGWTATFELKTNEAADDRRDLDALVAAMQLPDDQLLPALEQLVDLDRFIEFWAAEVLITHWDGYAGNTNNFFAYHDPTSDRFVFMPWGADGTFIPGTNPFGSGLVSVQAVGLMAYRLYMIPQTRDRYVAAMRDLLDRVWDEATLAAELDRMQALITPVADPLGAVGLIGELDNVRGFVAERRGMIDAETAAGPPAWPHAMREPPCFEQLGETSGSLTTTWGTVAADAFASGDGTMSMLLQGAQLAFTDFGANAGWDPDDPSRARLLEVALRSDGTVQLVLFQIDPARLVAGADLTIDWVDVVAMVYHYDPASGAFTLVGLIPSGTLHLDQIGTTDGAPVSASYAGPIVRSPF